MTNLKRKDGTELVMHSDALRVVHLDLNAQLGATSAELTFKHCSFVFVYILRISMLASTRLAWQHPTIAQCHASSPDGLI
mmetsp:Transcript_25461/g.57969  ORF Transcript_25461/g.57969 Transcript_25461/m.57969 type:complete len:80 (+) Transcript_25461:43-282(+)